MASKLLLVVVFVFNLIAFAPAVAPEQRKTKPSCHDNESLALLQFKESLINDCGEFGYSSNYSKVFFWASESNNCCGWNGVKCDKNIGHVVSLDLSNSCLLGTINSSSSLFQLIHLERLNLADNDFSYSQIPAGFTHLSRLTSLNISSARFFGQIPLEILELSKLVSLDLSNNGLELSELGLRSMAQNLINLKELYLTSVNIFSTVPKTFTNLSFLTSLFLDGCGLHGEFPIEIFHLSNFQSLNVSDNMDLNGSIPEFNQSNPLRSLELSYTSFSGKLPISIGNLKSLQHVGVIGCNFFGLIPSSFGNLAQLLSLRVSGNRFHGEFPIGIFHLPNLKELEMIFNENVTLSLAEFNRSSPLEFLEIHNMPFSSHLLHSIGNLKSLSSFLCRRCNFFGPILSSLSNLTQLSKLELEGNSLHGSIHELISKLELEGNSLHGSIHELISKLELEGNSLHGSIHELISKLVSLEHLMLDLNNLSGIMEFDLFLKLKNLRFLYLFNINISLPSSHGNLTQLTNLVLEENNLQGSIPELISKLVNLEYLVLESNNLNGIVEFDSFLKLKNLRSLYLLNINISLPSSLDNPTQIIELVLAGNNLYGSISELISKLVNIEYLVLDLNNLHGSNGIVKFDLFLKLKNLRSLTLFSHNISLLTKSSTNPTFPKLKELILRGFHLCEFPDFLRNQDSLLCLDLSHNEIHGQVPKWMSNAITNTKETLDLSFNFLTGFDEFLVFSSSLIILRLDSNKLQGSFPIPPPSIFWYSAPNNKLTGEIPHLICNLNFITVLDLSNNSLSGSLPQCLGNLSSFLLVLNLHKNNFHGTIPQPFHEHNQLKMIDLSQNQLWGPIPRSLVNCTKLELLNLGDNQVSNSFPFWLGGLSELKVLILRSNRLFGVIGNSNIPFDFPSLHILDLSSNNITGQLPSQYFKTWKSMQILDEKGLMYMEFYAQYFDHQYFAYQYFAYCLSMTFNNKGNEMAYKKILYFFIAIDLSNNKFEGEISEVVGHLKRLKLLNLSNNFLTGHIPSSLGNLTELESLDLSQNKLSGAIPLELVQLNFLEFLSVSQNHLTGPIPSGKQFDTFPNTSFSDNPGLCGSPLLKKCENFEHSHPPPSTFIDNQIWKSRFEFSWKVVVMGYGGGFVVRLVLGMTTKHDWFKTFVLGNKQATRSTNWRQCKN